jgi:ATP-dependent DNA helicase RecQ
MLTRLESGDFLQVRRLDHGGEVLDLTQAGQMALQNPAALEDLVGEAETPHQSPKKDDEESLEVDEALLRALRAWRSEQARARDVPPYVVFHDSHLRAIAARRPTTLEALAQVKGVGSKRLEGYGTALVALIKNHQEDCANDSQAQDRLG